MRFTVFIVLAICVGLQLSACFAQGQSSVTYHPRGTNASDVIVFGTRLTEELDIYYGIPFAKPPLGRLRFQAPQPIESVPPVINETDYKPGCMSDTAYVSEDCLYLNVWRPRAGNLTTPLPVLVFLYGGSFISGQAGALNYTNLMQQGIARDMPFITVTPNYRLGPFGFGYGKDYLSHNASNSGLKDVVAALRWVTENIAAFGGDPDHVTLGGQSAGAVAAALMTLVNAPLRLSGIILNSGSPAANPLAPTDEGFPDLYPALVTAVNCTNSSDTFECLRKTDAVVLQNATNALRQEDQYLLGFPWNPNVDYDFIPDRPSFLLRQGKFASIPILAGDDLDEGTLFVGPNTNTTDGVVSQVEWLEPVSPSNETIEELLNLYPDVPAIGAPYDTGNQTFGLPRQYKQIASLYGDLAFQHARRWMLQQMNANGWHNTWSWLWDASPNNDTRLGIYHTFDTQYFFGEVKETGFGAGGVNASRLAVQYWLNFIHFSDPNGQCPGEIAYWPKYVENGSTANMLQFRGWNTTFQVTVIQDDYRAKQIDFINAHPVDFNS